jgi:class 3 adenylate cyclase/tetratricopeptide (TPR) repeat protein
MVTCPQCRRANPDGFAFCGYCTSPLAPPSPEGVAEERKIVTVVFCDLVDFTASSEHADPEDVRARIAPYFTRLRAAAEAYGGTVEKFIGDAIQAVFGTPHAHEDDPERAVRAGLLVLREIQDLNAADPSLKLKVRVGIHTGEVLARLSLRHDESQGLVTGVVANIASRLQTVAPEGSIVVSEATYIATREVFQYEPMGSVELKGIHEPMAIWQPTMALAPLGVDITRTHAMPLVGRNEELELLERTFARAVRDGSVHTVTIVGEPGIGKTRLVVELNRYLDSSHEVVRWRQGRCVPYGKGVTFQALAEMIKVEARIYDSDDPETVASKLSDIVPAGPDATWVLQRLQPLLGLPAPEASIEENFAAWCRLLEHMAEQLPTVFAFEDLHWADDAMLDFVEHLAEYAEGVPMLIVSTARPELFERKPGWLGGIRNAATVDLPPLSDAETGLFAAGLLGEGAPSAGRPVLPADVHALIASRSGGNPLYAEEFVGLLIEREILRKEAGIWMLDRTIDIPLPRGIQSLIAARLDTLPVDRKAMLADAAVVGEVFWSGAIAEMSGIDRDAIANALHEMTRKKLVHKSRTSSIRGETEYRFWHALIRDVAYAQVTRTARALKHMAAAAWMERVAADRLADHSEVLANHYVSAFDLFTATGREQEARGAESSAVRYLALAGDRGMALNVTQAEAKYRRALELVAPEHPERARLLGRLAEAVQIRGNLSEAAALFEQAIAAHQERGEASQAAELMLRFAVVLGYRGEVAQSRTLLNRVIADLEQQDPTPQLAHAYAEKAYPGWGMSYGEAIAWADRAMALADTLDLPAVRARALVFRGTSRVAGLADPGGLDDLREGVSLSLSLGLTRPTYVAYFNLVGTLCYEDPSAALRVAEEGLRFADDRGLAEGGAWIRAFRLQAMFQVGQWQELLHEVDELITWAEPLGYSWITLTASYPKAWVLALTGRTSEARRLVHTLKEAGSSMRTVAASALVRANSQAIKESPNEMSKALDELVAAIRALPGESQELVCELARRAAVVGHRDLLEDCGELMPGKLAINRHGRETCAALAAELEERHAEALESFVVSERGWAEFGNPYEQAHALLGQARCLSALGCRDDVALPARKAGELFASLGAEPALRDTKGLIEPATS